MNIPEQLYYKLEREGKCYHPYNTSAIELPNGGKFKQCPKCKLYEDVWAENFPNLSDPDWDDFGWMIERAKKAEWWKRFNIWYLCSKQTGLEALFDPTALRDALVEYFGLEEKP